MKITLTNPTHNELSAAVAEHVAGWRRVPPPHGKKREWSHMLLSPSAKERGNDYKGQYIVVWKDGDLGGDVPKWATSADAVLPLLEKQSVVIANWILPDKGNCGWRVDIYDSIPDASLNKEAGALDKAFPRAACIALLRANGVEVVFTERIEA